MYLPTLVLILICLAGANVAQSQEGAARSVSQADKKPIAIVNPPLDASDEVPQSAHEVRGQAKSRGPASIPASPWQRDSPRHNKE
jgi:hypothetical protein